jgi:hypothetical protein
MPASDLKQIYNFANNFERAGEAILEAAGLVALIQGANETLPRSRVEVVFQRGEPLNEAILPDGTVVYDYWSGTLTFRIVTERPETQSSLLPGVSSLHEEWAATVLSTFRQKWNPETELYSTPFNSTNLPYYTVKKLRPGTEARDLDPRWLEDFTRHPYFVEFGIRSDAWPTA